MTTVLGLDIGATQSRAQLATDGVVVAESSAASASLAAAGAADAAAALADLLAPLPLRARLDAVCAGSAGTSVPGTRRFLTGQLGPLARAGRVVIVPDAALVLPAAGLGAGIALVCGTGSVAAGSYEGRAAQAGGWGYLLGDEGSGYAVVRDAVRVLLGRRDRGVPLGELGQCLLAVTGAGHLGTLQERFYARGQPRHWAKYAPAVLDSADPAVAAIATAAAGALAGLAVAVAGRLGAPASIPVVLAGGLLRHARLETAVRGALGDARPGGEVRALTREPVTGAVRLAEAAASGTPGAGA